MWAGKMGLNPAGVQQVVISGGPPAQPDDIPVSIVVRFSKPHPGKELIERIMRAENPGVEIEDIAYEGLTYFRAKKPAAEEPDSSKWHLCLALMFIVGLQVVVPIGRLNLPPGVELH